MLVYSSDEKEDKRERERDRKEHERDKHSTFSVYTLFHMALTHFVRSEHI